MKVWAIIIYLLAITVFLRAQDTIFVKNGQIIPAVIIEKGQVEIKYRRPGQPQTGAIYSVFVSDINKIRYSDGIVADYTSTEGKTESERVRPIDLAGTSKAFMFSAGSGLDYFQRKPTDDLLVLWRHKLNYQTASISSNPVSIPVSLMFVGNIDKAGRIWFGARFQLALTPSDAINATASNGSDEIKMRSFYLNNVILVGHALNHKKTLAAISEFGWGILSPSGYIKLNNLEYKLTGNRGIGFHTAVGADWLVTRRILVSARTGYRWLKVKEMVFTRENDNSANYFNLYVKPGVSEDLLSVKWNGPYAAIGLSWCFYVRNRFL